MRKTLAPSKVSGLDGSGFNSRAHDLEEAVCSGALQKLFYAFIAVAAEIHCRLNAPYRKWPWSLVRLADERMPGPQRLALARKFRRASPCCLDPFCGERLQAMVSDPVDLLPQGRLHPTVAVLSMNKVMNIEVEDSFARAARCRASSAGRQLETMMCWCKFEQRPIGQCSEALET